MTLLMQNFVNFTEECAIGNMLAMSIVNFTGSLRHCTWANHYKGSDIASISQVDSALQDLTWKVYSSFVVRITRDAEPS